MGAHRLWTFWGISFLRARRLATALAFLAIPDQRPAVFPRESVAALKYVGSCWNNPEKAMFAQPVTTFKFWQQIALLIGRTGRVRDFSSVTSASPYTAEWVLACLQRKVFRGGHGDGFKQQDSASM